MLKHCVQCGKEFNIIPARANTARFCSRTCRRGENSPTWKGGGGEKICAWCGKEFAGRRPSDNRRFCSIKCNALWRSENVRGESHSLWKERIKLYCEICGKGFEITPSRAGARFCSLACMGLWKSKALQGENGPAWKGGDVKLHCEVCDKEFGVKPHLANTARFCSLACMGLWRTENMCGANNPNWHGGISFEPYGLEWTDTLKRKIRKRDNHTCAICGEVWQIGDRFHVHHINYCKTDNRSEDLITLCRDCHIKTNHNREYYKTLLAPIAIARTAKKQEKDGTKLVSVMETTTYTALERVYGGA